MEEEGEKQSGKEWEEENGSRGKDMEAARERWQSMHARLD